MLVSSLAVAFLFLSQGNDPYVTKTLHGFTLRIHREALAATDELTPALELLGEKLEEITQIVPEPALTHLKKIPIWIERNNPDFPCACYHPSRDWLSQHGYDVRKEDGVEIANPKNFVTWTINDQPMMVLHELAHGYHDIVFGYDDPYIRAVYQHAKVNGLYDRVRYHRGGEREAYAKTNPMEYFAELTEAYFGYNDFYPFDAEDLKKHDPKGYEMCRRLWGEPKARSHTKPKLWNQPPSKDDRPAILAQGR